MSRSPFFSGSQLSPLLEWLRETLTHSRKAGQSKTVSPRTRFDWKDSRKAKFKPPFIRFQLCPLRTKAPWDAALTFVCILSPYLCVSTERCTSHVLEWAPTAYLALSRAWNLMCNWFDLVLILLSVWLKVPLNKNTLWDLLKWSPSERIKRNWWFSTLKMFYFWYFSNKFGLSFSGSWGTVVTWWTVHTCWINSRFDSFCFFH